MEEKKVYEDGIYQISNAEYHSSAGLSRSQLMKFIKSPYHYQQDCMLRKVERKETEEMTVGSLVHTLVLEPEKFHDEYVLRPELNRKTNDGKYKYNQFCAMLAGRREVTTKVMKLAEAMRDAILDNTEMKSMLEPCQKEISIYFTHQPTGIQCKVRPDAWDNSIIYDLKTTDNCEAHAFQRSAVKYGYYLQAGMMYQALQSKSVCKSLLHFIILAVEKTQPHATAIFTMNQETQQAASMLFDHHMANFKKAMVANKFPTYPTSSLIFPLWAQIVTEVDFDEI